MTVRWAVCLPAPRRRVREGAKVGTFVEVKNSDIGAGAKVPHLSYIGDAEVGEDANLGASTITANYDGREKHRTKLGKSAKTGVYTSLVAPRDVGDRAYTGAGSVITGDIPEGALGIARQRQTNVEGYADRVEEDPQRASSSIGHCAGALVEPPRGVREEADDDGRARQQGAGGEDRREAGVALTDAGLKTFADGEVYRRYAESIRGADLFIVQSICGSEREGLTVNDALWELLLVIHAAKHASAHRIVAVTPWFGYSRQDKKSAPREPISARLVAEVLETAGADRRVAMDLHAGQLQGFFSSRSTT